MIEETLAQHRLAVGGARQDPEGRVAEVVDAAPIDEVATSSPRNRAPPTRDRCYRHLSVERKNKYRLPS